jgi:hypothetical protein
VLSSDTPPQFQQRPSRFTASSPNRPASPEPELTRCIAIFYTVNNHQGYVAASG